jgi:large subunit ribosomal protein L21
MKYAIVESGGKQYKAVPGEIIDVDRLSQDVGEKLELDVLLFSDGEKVEVGAPTVSGVKVKASVQGMIKGPKLIAFKYTPKKRIRRKMGHRQQYTRLIIDEIVGI